MAWEMYLRENAKFLFNGSNNMYSVENILSLSDINKLLEVSSLLTPEYKENYYNLHNVYYSHVFSKYHYLSPFEKLNAAVAERKIRNHYILTYQEGSYTRIHQDHDVAAKTVVTLLHATDDLMGGECIFYGKNDCPVIHNMSVGESVIYDQSVFHGVGLVKTGCRTVLVSWYY